MIDQALVEYQARQAARKSIDGFREYIKPSGHPDFQFGHAAHHKVLTNALEAMERGDLQRVIVMMPPGSAKSTVGSVQFLSWYAMLHPNHKILAVSSTQSLAENFARRRRQVCLTSEWQVLADTQVLPDMQSVGNFGYGNGGEQFCAGVGTSVVGRRAQILAVDDSVSSYEEINSEARREAMWEWYQAELRSRLTPGGLELVIGTRWHAQDIIGRLLDGDDSNSWHVIRMPMLCDDPENDPMGRAMNEPLWPEWFSQQQIDENKRHPLRWASMYQQVPLSGDGSWLNHTDLPIVDRLPPGCIPCAAMDIAVTEGRGDFTVIMVAAMDAERTLYIVNVWRDRVTPDKVVHKLFELHDTYKFREVLIDDDVGSKVFRTLAHDIMRREGRPVPLIPMPTRGNAKEVRATAIRGFAKMGAVKLVSGFWNGALLAEVEKFPHSDFDDQVDCMALLGRRMQSLSAPAAETTKTKPKEIKGMVKYVDGKFVLSDTLDMMHKARSGGSSFNKGRI